MSKKTLQKGGQKQNIRSGQGGAGTRHGPKKSQKQKSGTKKGGGGAALQDVPLVGNAVDSDASDLEVSEEDLEFVERHRRRLGFLEKLNQSELDRSIREKQERQAKAAEEERQQAAAGSDGSDGGGSDDGDGDGGDGDGGGEGASDDEAAAYERAPRRAKTEPKDQSAGGLPIKTLGGEVVFEPPAKAKAKAKEAEAALAEAAAIQVEGVTITDDMEAAVAETKRRRVEEEARRAKEAQRKAAAAAKKAEESSLPPALRGLNLSALDPAARRSKLQEVMAAAAQKLLAAPDSAVGELRTLQALVADGDSMVSRLALLSLFAVFKDVIPGYRIRPPTDKELEVKVSKEVAKLRDFEQALLKGYQTYLRSLLDAANCVATRTGTLSHSRVAVRCLAGLLAAHPHFNYTSDILQAIVPRMASPDPETRSLAVDSVRQLLAASDSAGDGGGAGGAALEAVQLVADMVRRRKCVAPPEVVRCLEVLRFRDVARPGDGEDEEGGRKRHKGKKAERREAKRRRKEDDVTRAFKEASAGPDKEELARLQSSMLEALFEIYFRVLKHCCAVGLAAPGRTAAAADHGNEPGLGPSSTAAAAAAAGGGGAAARVPSASLSPPWSRARLLKKCPLLHPVLDGLARYTHLISVDYMNDLLSALSDLLAAPGLPLPERLRCLATTASLLRGHGEALNVDRRELYVQLYDTLLQVPIHSLLGDDTPPPPPPKPKQTPAQPDLVNGHHNNNQPDGGGDDDEEDDGDIAMAVASERAAEAAVSHGSGSGSGPGQGLDPESGPEAGSGSSVAALLARVLESLLVEAKLADMQRGAAFVKRMAGAALLAGPGEAMALWATIARLLRRYPKLANMLDYEGEAPTVGGRPYDPDCPDPSEAGALASTLWEVCLAAGPTPQHYHPHVAQAAGSIMALRPGAVAAAAAAAASGGGGGGAVHLTGPLGLPVTIAELAEAYDSSGGLVRPTPPVPKGAGGGAGGGKRGKGGRRGGAGAAAAAALSPEFLEDLSRLAEEYGGAGAGGSEWEGLDLNSDSGSDAGDTDSDGDGGDDDGGDAARRRRQAQAGTSGRGGGGGDATSVAAAALRRMFLESYRFRLNRQLRREKALEVERLKRFHIHLQRRQAELAAAAAAGPPAQLAAARSARAGPAAPGGHAGTGTEGRGGGAPGKGVPGKGQAPRAAPGPQEEPALAPRRRQQPAAANGGAAGGTGSAAGGKRRR